MEEYTELPEETETYTLEIPYPKLSKKDEKFNNDIDKVMKLLGASVITNVNGEITTKWIIDDEDIRQTLQNYAMNLVSKNLSKTIAVNTNGIKAKK